VGAELLAQGPPRGVDVAAIQESLLDGYQQTLGQHAEENVCLGAMLQMMEDRPLHQGALHGTKGRFHPGQ
jgi:hypothetical protein